MILSSLCRRFVGFMSTSIVLAISANNAPTSVDGSPATGPSVVGTIAQGRHERHLADQGYLQAVSQGLAAARSEQFRSGCRRRR